MILTILLCLAGTAPPDCTPATALEIVSRPASAIECVAPQALIAEFDPGDAGLVRVTRCERRS